MFFVSSFSYPWSMKFVWSELTVIPWDLCHGHWPQVTAPLRRLTSLKWCMLWRQSWQSSCCHAKPKTYHIHHRWLCTVSGPGSPAHHIWGACRKSFGPTSQSRMVDFITDKNVNQGHGKNEKRINKTSSHQWLTDQNPKRLEGFCHAIRRSKAWFLSSLKNGSKTRMLLLQATVKRFQFDLYVNLEGKHMLISSWFQK